MEYGGAMVESILIVGVLTIFMIGVPMIGSLIDLKQTTIQASRYSAWEKTVYVDPASAPKQIDERFFRDASSTITSGTNSGAAPNHLWGEIPQSNNPNAPQDRNTSAHAEPQGDDLQLYQRARVTIGQGNVSVTQDVGEQALAGLGANGVGLDNGTIYRGVSTVVTTLGRAISPDGWDEGNPVEDGLVRSKIAVQVEGNSMLASGGVLNEHTSIFIDGWSAAEDDTIRERVHGFVPTNRLQQLGEFISRIKILPIFDDLEHLDDAFGCVKNNIVTNKELVPESDNPGHALKIYQEQDGDKC